jgi:hypothetical protein
MNLRTLLLVLLAANGLVFAWMVGWLEPAWPAPGQAEREPARLSSQVNPGVVTVLPPGPASAAVGAARQSAIRCVEAGPFGVVDAAAAEAALETANLPGLPRGGWERDLRGPSQVWLRIPRADAALRAQLQTLASGNAALAAGFKACAM